MSDSDYVNILIYGFRQFWRVVMSSAIKDRFKEVRKMLNLNQEQFSKEIGISRSHISGIENGKDNPSTALIKLICMKYNINEEWLRDGIGHADPDWNVSTDEGIISKYNAMRVLYEQKLKSRTGEDLVNTVESFTYLDAIISPRKLNDEDKSKYLTYICKALDNYEKLIFSISTSSKSLVPSKNDVKEWLSFRNECEEDLNIVFENLKNAVNLYLSLFDNDLKL